MIKTATRITGACLFAVSFANGANSAPQTFNTALPVAEGEFIARQQFFYKSKSDDPTPANRNVEVWGSLSVLGYGITADLSLFAALPIVNKQLKINTPGGRIKRKTSGLGDARIFARYTAFKDNVPDRTFRIAPFAGLKLPTGASRDRDSFGLLPFSLQAGSGSWDPFGGVVATYQTLDFQIDTQASFKFNTRANNYKFGNEARFDVSLQYRLWPRELEDTTSGFLYGVLEGNLLYKGRDKLGGVKQANTGGTQFFIAPGLQYVTKRWIAEAIVQLPILQNLRGAGQFGYPTDVNLSANERLYVADGYNDRIQVFDPSGKFQFKWGGPFALNIFGPFNGWFATVTSVAIDNKGNVFVADFYNYRIQKFTADGRFLVGFGTKGSGPGKFFHPIAMAVADDGSVFIADFGNNRIQKWRQKLIK